MNRSQRGFTLIELIVVISIIAIILLIAMPQYALYKSNLLLKKEAKRLECFIKDVRTLAKTQCVDIDVYNTDINGITMNFPGPALPVCAQIAQNQQERPWDWIAENWITPACADGRQVTPPSGCRGLKAKSIRINYLRLNVLPEGIEASSTYNINTIMTITPSGYRDSNSILMSGLTYQMWSSSTPKILYVTINDSGISQVTENPPTAPGGSGDD